jgi:hypothetical protein
MVVHVSEFMLSGEKKGPVSLTALTVHHTTHYNLDIILRCVED